MERYHYRGELAERPLPEMLNTIDRFGVPGVLEAISDDVVKRIYLSDGQIVHATSSKPEDSLGAHLMRCGLVGGVQLRRVRRSRRGAAPLGPLLLEQGLMTASEIAEAQRDQIERIVWSLFRWSEGSVTFSIGDSGTKKREDLPDENISIPIRYAIKEGARYYPHPKELLELLGSTSKVEKQYEPIDLIDLALREEEISLLKGIDDATSLEELCSSSTLGLDDGVRLLYGFSVLQLVNIEPTQDHLDSLAAGQGSAGTKEKTSGQSGLRIQIKTDGDRFSE